MADLQKYDYKALLRRAESELPTEVIIKERFEIPKAVVFNEGKTTIFKNLFEIANKVNRTPEHLFTYLLKELGTAGEIDGERAVFQGRILEARVKERVQKYIDRYVLCRECERPDTVLKKRNRTLVMKCEACGAIHPVAGKLRKD